jgi:beta-mannosidase
MNRTSTSLILLFFYKISALTLRDHEIASSSTPYYLDNLTWFASETSLGLNISATVPGDIITDLQKSGLISDPWHELNFLDNRSLWDPNLSWTFQTSMIEIPVTNSSSSNSTFLLVFEGVKMGAHVLFNTIELGTVTNQFMRYVFQIPLDSVRQGPMNEIQVRFDSSLQTLNRFCASSGGWDWQAVSQLEVNDTVFGVSPSFSSGIWKSVYILQASPLVITDIVPLVTYLGEYPVTPLTDGSHGGFQVNITAHIVVSEGDYPTGFFSAQSEWGISQNSSIMTLPSGVSNVTLILQAPASLIKLWWPNGLGNHSLYNISVTWTSTSTVTPSITAVRRIGFRTAALVTVNDTNATVVAESKGMNGSGSFGMFFRINGAAIFSRGANLVPTEMLEGRLDAIAYHTLVQSASAAHFNMIRVWGGGIYPPDIFYDMCDSEGILLYHDLMFAGEGHDIASAKQPFSNTTNFTIESEISHQIKRLSHHPSIILYDSANEVIVQRSGPTALYVSLVLAAVVRDDPSRIIWPASPAAGWISGVDRLWGSFNGQPLIPVGTGHIWDAGNERHGTYIAGVGAGNWTTVIRDPWTQDHTFDPGTPLAYLPSPEELTGVEYPSIFASEFGTTSMSSFEAFSASLDESSYGLHGGNKPSNCTIAPSGGFFQNCTGRNAMAQRNWACDNVIWSYFGPNLLNLSGIDAFKGQLFQCLIASAIHMQIDIEQRRAQNYLGAIFWMFQDSWVSGSWGSIEYVTPSINGTTLRGGRWKPMHNWLESHMFQDVMSACGYVGRSKTFVCYVNNARPDTSFEGTLSITAINLINGTENEWETLPVFVKQGPNEILWLTPTTSLPNASTTVLIASLIDVDGNSFDEHIVHLTPPMNLLVQPATLSVDVATVPNLDRSINITVSSDKVALFVTLTSAAPGRFSNNAFLLRPLYSPKIISWIPFEDTDPISDIEILRNTIRIEDMSAYVN